MHRLLYISTTRTPITPALLDDILAASRRRNAAAGITGLLVAGGRRFLQVLEGERAAVEQTFARICDDPRHHAVVRLSEGPIAARNFPNWAMGSVKGGDAAATGPASQGVAALIAPIENADLRGYFTGFVEVQSAA